MEAQIMIKKVNINDIFYKWLVNYKRSINFSIINKPTKALNDSFNAGFTLSERKNEMKIKQITTLLSEVKERENFKGEVNKNLLKKNEKLEKYIKDLETELSYTKKRA
jgi:hypothetical protein